MKRMAVIFNSDYQHWPMGGMITYVNQAVSMLSEFYEIELWGCAVDGREPEAVTVGESSYPIRANTTAKTRKKLIPNVVKCFWGNMAGSTEFRAERYDILYFHLSASMLGWFLGEKLRRPFGRRKDGPLVILHQHGMAYRDPIGDRLDYFAMDLADLVFLTTDRKSLEIHKTHTKNPRVIWMPSMVDTDFFHVPSEQKKHVLRAERKIDENKKVFIYTGRITGWKNPHLLLDAFEQYQQRRGDGYLIYVGDGNELPALQVRIAEKGLAESVRLTGKLDRAEIRAYLQAADVFTLPSRGEGVSVSTLEAMAAGLPVVAFDVEGMSGMVEPCSGILVERQTAEDYADGMEQAVCGQTQFRPTDTSAQYSIAHVREMMVGAIENVLALKGNEG